MKLRVDLRADVEIDDRWNEENPWIRGAYPDEMIDEILLAFRHQLERKRYYYLGDLKVRSASE